MRWSKSVIRASRLRLVTDVGQVATRHLKVFCQSSLSFGSALYPTRAGGRIRWRPVIRWKVSIKVA